VASLRVCPQASRQLSRALSPVRNLLDNLALIPVLSRRVGLVVNLQHNHQRYPRVSPLPPLVDSPLDSQQVNQALCLPPRSRRVSHRVSPLPNPLLSLLVSPRVSRRVSLQQCLLGSQLHIQLRPLHYQRASGAPGSLRCILPVLPRARLLLLPRLHRVFLWIRCF
jgi:hypothetical protein